MAVSNIFTKRCAFCSLVILIAALLVVFTIRSGYHRSLHTAITGYIGAQKGISNTGDTGGVRSNGSGGGLVTLPNAGKQLDRESVSKRRGVKVYRFSNGRIAVGNSIYSLSKNDLDNMSPAQLEVLYENVVLETTADCSTERRFGRKEDGGWDLCLVGPFTPQQPCFSFSFGVNNIWEFDDEVASSFKCQIFTFDPSMSQASHQRSDNVAFLKEGIHSRNGKLNEWSVDSYLGFLKRFGVERYIIDILKMDVESSEWPALETAVRDGSLKNVKQLLLETHIGRTGTAEDFLRYLSVLKALHDLGFRQWHHNWNTFGNFKSGLNKGQEQTCCHELYYININFLTGTQQARNPSDLELVSPLARVKISKTNNYNQADAVRSMSLTSLTTAQLEIAYFGILEQQHIRCPYSIRIGDAGDGGWDVCFSLAYSLKESKPCIAFSFGINNIWTYDDILAEKYHCNVHMFDPSMTNVNDYQRKKTSWFYRTGLSSENKVETNGWKMRTLCTLFSEMGYKDKTIDLLKIDIEHWEWVSFEKALSEGCLKNVKQLLFESHTSELLRQKSDYAHFIRIWQGLFSSGFRTWKWHKNPVSVFFQSAASPQVHRACCYEHYMLNTNFIKL